MEAYTIEEVELLRKRGGMTYEEAVALLEYHNGNLAKALIDLEKNGKLREDRKCTGCQTDAKRKVQGFFRRMYRNRVKIHKGNTTIANISVLYGVPCLLCAPHMTVFGIIAAMILGYRFSFSQMDENFATVDLKKPVKTAEKAAETSEAEPVAPSAVDLSKELNEQVEALTEKEIPTIQVPAQATC